MLLLTSCKSACQLFAGYQIPEAKAKRAPPANNTHDKLFAFSPLSKRAIFAIIHPPTLAGWS
jgi:hypothetical protein